MMTQQNAQTMIYQPRAREWFLGQSSIEHRASSMAARPAIHEDERVATITDFSKTAVLVTETILVTLLACSRGKRFSSRPCELALLRGSCGTEAQGQVMASDV
jgi:hypothetical protein